MALRFGVLAFDLACSAPPLRVGRRIDFPKADHRRPPAYFILRFGARPLGYSDFGDLMRLGCLLGASWGDLGGS